MVAKKVSGALPVASRSGTTRIRETGADRVFNAFNIAALFVVGFVSVFPLLFVLSVSLTPISEVFKNGGFIIIPRKITLEAYKLMLTRSYMPQAFEVTVVLTIVGTLMNMVLTLLLAYPLSRMDLPGRSILIFFIVFTMLFNGGIIPTYLVVKQMGLLDTLWAMIIPNVVWAYNTLLMKGFFENLPNEIFESARIDGAGEWRVLYHLVVPLSTPVLATVGLFYAVGHWNEFFQGIMYITNPVLRPLQVVLRAILIQSEGLETLENPVPVQTMQMAAVVFAAAPIILVYPFLQRYFVKGVMLGSIKG